MPKGFFKISRLRQSKAPLPLVPQCGACGLYRGCKSPKMPYTGKGRKGILLVGEAPGETEDQLNRQFCGKTGQKLERTLRKWDIEMREDCWITNALICHPPNNKIPRDSNITDCLPNLIKTVNTLQPEKIILLGGVAVESMMQWLWRKKVGPIKRWAGWTIPHQKLNCWICPTYHPSYVVREEERKPSQTQVTMFWERHLEAAFELKGRPWNPVPDFREQCRVVLDEAKACRLIQRWVDVPTPIAFDYETNMLKPDGSGSQILCCSLSDGARSFAFPWTRATRAAMRDFLVSSTPKTGANIKFEERWTWEEFGHGVVNWDWDDMLAAHWLDNRGNISGVKFQAFVLFGQESYNDHLEELLEGRGSNIPNDHRDIELRDLLLYCSMDSLMEAMIAHYQKTRGGLL